MPAKKCPRQNSVFLEIRSRRIMRCYLSRLSMGTLYHKLPAKNSRPRPNLELLRIATRRRLRRMQAGRNFRSGRKTGGIAACRCQWQMQAGRNFRSRAIGGPSRSRPGNGNAARRASVSPKRFPVCDPPPPAADAGGSQFPQRSENARNCGLAPSAAASPALLCMTPHPSSASRGIGGSHLLLEEKAGQAAGAFPSSELRIPNGKRSACFRRIFLPYVPFRAYLPSRRWRYSSRVTPMR